MSNVRPALTAEEWAAKACRRFPSGERDNGLDIAARSGKAGDYLSVANTSPESYSSFEKPEQRHAIAALALYGLPFGFTREDVEVLRKEYDAVMDAQSDEFWDSAAVERAMAWQSIADRIESILPLDPR